MLRTALLLLILLPTLFSFSAKTEAHTLRLADHQIVTWESLVDDLQGARIVLVGELHDRIDHHQAQLQIIDGLRKAGVELCIGVEMFRAGDQSVLDRWVAGDLDEEAFLPYYERNWGIWQVYRELFLYAREQRIPMVGLNLPREISQKVAREGFASLEDRHLQQLPKVRCDVSPAYQQFIRRALNLHATSEKAFLNFCEAQVLWDTFMAQTAEDYLERHPGRIMVILAGAGHAWRMGIPAQLDKIRGSDVRVVLPSLPERLPPSKATPQEADYLLIGTEEGPIH